MNLHLYPANWSGIAQDIKTACDWTCQACGKQCQRPGEFNLGWQHRLTLAHISQDYNAPVVQVAALCTPCHLKHDAPLVWVARRRAERWRQRKAGQLELLAARG